MQLSNGVARLSFKKKVKIYTKFSLVLGRRACYKIKSSLCERKNKLNNSFIFFAREEMTNHYLKNRKSNLLVFKQNSSKTLSPTH